jgi:hypothetical protein
MISQLIRSMVLGMAVLAGSAAALPPEPEQPHGQNPPAPAMAQMPQDLQHAMAVGPKGTIAIRGIQGTANGPAVAGDEVEIILVHRGQPVKQIKSKLDDNGMTMVGDIPVGVGVQPVVRIKHAGVLYQESGTMMDASTPRASMNITVYEVTDQMPVWKVLSRQVMAARLPMEMDIVEVVTVENMGDKTWLGGAANSEGRRDTVVLGVPEQAEKFNLESGFHGWCCTSFAANSLHVQMPLMPGKFTYRFSYTVPISEGKADLRVSCAAVADQTVIAIPDDGADAQPFQVEAAGSDTVQGTRIRRFKAANLPAGSAVGLILTGLSAQAGAPTPAGPADSIPASGFSVTWIALGIGVLVVIGIAFAWMRGTGGS